MEHMRLIQGSWGAGTQQHAGRMNGQNFFDGWSNFKRLKNNEPPLVITYSSPMRIKLTAEVPSLLMSSFSGTLRAESAHLVFEGSIADLSLIEIALWLLQCPTLALAGVRRSCTSAGSELC